MQSKPAVLNSDYSKKTTYYETAEKGNEIRRISEVSKCVEIERVIANKKHKKFYRCYKERKIEKKTKSLNL